MKILIKGANVLRPDYSTDIADIALQKRIGDQVEELKNLREEE